MYKYYQKFNITIYRLWLIILEENVMMKEVLNGINYL